MSGPGTNTGHGHVWERPDGYKAECGGPGMCTTCTADQLHLQDMQGPGGLKVVQRYQQNTAHHFLRSLAAAAELASDMRIAKPLTVAISHDEWRTLQANWPPNWQAPVGVVGGYDVEGGIRFTLKPEHGE